MTDHAATVRGWMKSNHYQLNDQLGHSIPTDMSYDTALAALAALEQELAAHKSALRGTQVVRDEYKARATTAEDRVHELADVLAEAKRERDEANASVKSSAEFWLERVRSAERERDEWKKDRDYVWGKGVELKEQCDAAELELYITELERELRFVRAQLDAQVTTFHAHAVKQAGRISDLERHLQTQLDKGRPA